MDCIASVTDRFKESLKLEIYRESIFSKLKQVKTPEALITVLDEMTCAGCHQSRSVAGFHVFGYERPNLANEFNSIEVGVSIHYIQDKKRRFSYNWRLIMDQQSPGEFAVRPLSFQNPTSQGVSSAPGVGEACLMDGEAERHFKGRLAQNLSCKSGLQCVSFTKTRMLRFGLVNV